MKISFTASKLISLILVSFGVAGLFGLISGNALTKIDSMSPEACVQHFKSLYQHSYLYRYILWFFLGGIYLCAIETTDSIIRRFLPKESEPKKD